MSAKPTTPQQCLIDLGPGWRLMTVGEKIDEGDRVAPLSGTRTEDACAFGWRGDVIGRMGVGRLHCFFTLRPRPDSAPGYAMLKAGDIMQDGDERLSAGSRLWKPMPADRAGRPVPEYMVGRYRRPIQSPSSIEVTLVYTP